jgi:hypothetical protein
MQTNGQHQRLLSDVQVMKFRPPSNLEIREMIRRYASSKPHLRTFARANNP